MKNIFSLKFFSIILVSNHVLLDDLLRLSHKIPLKTLGSGFISASNIRKHSGNSRICSVNRIKAKCHEIRTSILKQMILFLDKEDPERLTGHNRTIVDFHWL